ncbi:putative membrane protein [Citrobacter freundii]|nr:putative membrane protein [Citrobacter freundii]
MLNFFSFNGILGTLAPNTASLFVAVLIFIVENSCKALNVSL